MSHSGTQNDRVIMRLVVSRGYLQLNINYKAWK